METGTTARAVFLSYASQDAEAARHILEALRSAGIEVWFDQSELRGGDAWDQSIRRRIKDCVLFLPIISAQTQARREGYFRLEWKLADDRTQLMAKGTPFILPVWSPLRDDPRFEETLKLAKPL
jgi:TIR domain